jgi:hypothetical protein
VWRRALLRLEAPFPVADGGGDASVVALLERVVALEPLDGEALLLLGRHHLEANEPDPAMLWLARAASVDALEAEAELRHAQVLAAPSRHGDAAQLLRGDHQLKPRDEVARHLEQGEPVERSRRRPRLVSAASAAARARRRRCRPARR